MGTFTLGMFFVMRHCVINSRFIPCKYVLQKLLSLIGVTCQMNDRERPKGRPVWSP
jgi:hypothetical protein